MENSCQINETGGGSIMSFSEEDPKGMTRRIFIKEAAAAGTLVASSGALADYAHAVGPKAEKEESSDSSLKTINTYGADLEKSMYLRTYPIGIKMLKSEAEIPQGAVRPKKDRGEHLAMCQAFAIVRRQGVTLAMFLEDHWCFEPIISYGLVETPKNYLEGFAASFFMADKEAAAKHAREIPRIPYGMYSGMVFGPLRSINFVPDITMIYSNTAQLRHMLLALRYKNGYQVTPTLDPIGSCVQSVVPSLLNKECWVSVPDPGDYERAMVGEDEMILTVPSTRLQELMDGVYHFEKSNRGFRRFTYSIRPDFPQPPFYQDYFKEWGLDPPKNSE
jgi:uncharacterized protein (DUF169 family)